MRLSLTIHFCLGAAYAAAQTVDISTMTFQSVPLNQTGENPFAVSDPGTTTTTYTTLAICGSQPCATTATPVDSIPSSGSAPFFTLLSQSSVATSSSSVDGETFSSLPSSSSTTIPQVAPASTSGDPDSTIVAAPNPTGRDPLQTRTRILIGVFIGLSLFTMLAAATILLLRRRSRKQHRDSKFVLDSEAEAASAGRTSSRTDVEAHDTPPQLAQLEQQARRIQEEIEAVRRANRSEFECAKGYTVDESQSRKFDTLAACAGILKTSRGADPAEDAPPGYEPRE
ncbi:hypothetical protein C8R43DRAFT_1111454 [Mycena crocata]|nr:hypothetical protein C8R43DRAFT_1111454 [Mycena crocata]